MSRNDDPIARFRKLLERARVQGEPERGTAVTLATSDADGRPSARMVLLKGVDERGFVFFTNFGSRKALELEANPHAALVFHWHGLGVQVRVEGAVERIAEEESDAYFATRARQSQLGAWASRQSEPLEGRRQLLTRYLQLKARYAGRQVPRPSFWGGYRVRPRRIEFWLARLGRLHDRILYERDGDTWSRRLLYP